MVFQQNLFPKFQIMEMQSQMLFARLGRQLHPKEAVQATDCSKKLMHRRREDRLQRCIKQNYGRMDSVIIQFGETHVKDANYLIAKRNLL